MKALQFLLCAATAASISDASAQRGTNRVQGVEVIVPFSTNLFAPAPNVVRRESTNFFVGSTTNRLGANVPAGATNRLNAIGLTNAPATPANSQLIGPVFPTFGTNLTPTGRDNGFGGAGPGQLPAPLVTNALPSFPTNRDPVTGAEAPGPAVPGTPAGTTPLTPPVAPNPPPPSTPVAPPNPNAPPNVPSSSANPTPPNTTPLAPPSPPARPAIPPAPAPPATPGGARG